jgi:uncharacterized protein YkwD
MYPTFMHNFIVTICSIYRQAFLSTRMLIPLLLLSVCMGCSSADLYSSEILLATSPSSPSLDTNSAGTDVQIDHINNTGIQKKRDIQTAENTTPTNWCYEDLLSDFEFEVEELELLDLINDYRLQENPNLPKLSILPEASLVARLHSQDMANLEVDFGHTGFENRVKVLAEVLDFVVAAENVGYSQSRFNPLDITFENWLESTTHRENIEGHFEWTGIGIHSVEWNDEGKTKREVYITQIFLY